MLFGKMNQDDFAHPNKSVRQETTCAAKDATARGGQRRLPKLLAALAQTPTCVACKWQGGSVTDLGAKTLGKSPRFHTIV